MNPKFFIAATLIAIVLASCTKEAVDTRKKEAANVQVLEGANTGKPTLVMDPLKVNLEGWFAFNGNLKDQTGKLTDGTSTARFASYTFDHKGKPNAAIKFDGTYGVKLFNVPVAGEISIAAWVKNNDANVDLSKKIITSSAAGLGMCTVGYEQSMGATITASNLVSKTVLMDATSTAWHHYVITFYYNPDGYRASVYKDGVGISGMADWPNTISPALVGYYIGYFRNTYFKGCIDDLRFYSRALTDSDVKALFNLQ